MNSTQLQPADALCPRCGTRQPPFTPTPDHPGWMACSASFENHNLFRGHDVCGFECPVSWQRLPFARIGASGVPADGQSTWNVLAHQRLWNLGGLPNANVSLPPLGLPANVEANLCHESLLEGVGLAATQPDRCSASDGGLPFLKRGRSGSSRCVSI